MLSLAERGSLLECWLLWPSTCCESCRRREYTYLVRVKTSITLPQELLSRLDLVDKNRSALLERAAVSYLAVIERERRDRQDREIIDRNSERLNKEALDALSYQQIP